MPRIISYDSQQVNAPNAELQPRIVRNVTAVSEAQGQFAQGVVDLSEAVYKSEVQDDVQNTSDAVSKLNNQYTTRLQTELDAGTLDSQKFMEDYQNDANKFSDKISTNKGSDFYNRQIHQLGDQLTRQSSMAQAQYKGKVAVQTFNDNLNLNGNTLQKNPASFDSTLKISFESLDAQVVDGTIPAMEAQKLKTMTGKELSKNAMRGWINLSPQAARKALGSGTYDQYLDSDDRNTIETHIDALEKAQLAKAETLGKLKFKDPWQFLKNVGVAAPAVDIRDPKSLVERQMFIDGVQKKYGYYPDEVPFLNTGEARGITRLIKQQTPEETTALLQQVAVNAPPEIYSQIAAQVFKDQGAYGVSMAVSADDTETAEKIVAGKQLMTNKEKSGLKFKGVVTASSNDVSKSFDAYVGNSIADPKLRIQLKDAAFSHYTKTRFDSGDDLDVFDEDSFNESVDKILGPVAQINDQKIVSFRDKKGHFVPAGELESEFEELDPKILQETQGDVPRLLDGTPLDLEKSGDRINPVTAANGKYFLKRDDEILYNKNGKPYELDMKTYLPMSREARKKTLFGKVKGFFHGEDE